MRLFLLVILFGTIFAFLEIEYVFNEKIIMLKEEILCLLILRKHLLMV